MSKHYLDGAEWSLKNDSHTYGGTLDENGQADLKNISVGEYIFSLSKEGYVTKEQEVKIDLKPFNIDVSLEKEPEKPKPAKKATKKPTKKTTKKDEDKEVKEEKPKKETKTKKASKSSTKKTAKKDEE